MKNLMPQITRKRFIVEGFYNVDLDEDFLKSFLVGLSGRLGMTIIAGPFIFSPDKYSSIHHGLGGFVAWTESGCSFYSWSQYRFFTPDIYSCKDFEEDVVLSYVKDALKCPQWFGIELNMISNEAKSML